MNSNLRSVIFVATPDIQFEGVALDAILDSGYGVRMARNFRNACLCLKAGTGDLALAIVDLDLSAHGRALLHGLGGFAPDFPILTVADEYDAFAFETSIQEIAAECLVKPIEMAVLKQSINRLCQRNRAGNLLARV